MLNFETGQLDDGIVLSRKGGMIVDIEVFGKAAHSGMAVREGRSAILDIAHKIIAIEALNDIDNGILLQLWKNRRRDWRKRHTRLRKSQYRRTIRDGRTTRLHY